MDKVKHVQETEPYVYSLYILRLNLNLFIRPNGKYTCLYPPLSAYVRTELYGGSLAPLDSFLDFNVYKRFPYTAQILL